jgi:hypothetical protein
MVSISFFTLALSTSGPSGTTTLPIAPLVTPTLSRGVS